MVVSAGVFEETLVNLVVPYGFLNNEWPRGRKGALEVEVKTSMPYFINFNCFLRVALQDTMEKVSGESGVLDPYQGGIEISWPEVVVVLFLFFIARYN